MPLTYTPLRYPGGKSKYARLFEDVINDNELHSATFVEVFAGGAGAAIALLRRGLVGSLILNDLDPAIYAFWHTVKNSPDELIRRIRRTRISMAEWRRQKIVFDRQDTSDLVGLGFSTFYLNRCNHSGILDARPVGGMKQLGRYKLNARFNKDTSINKITKIAELAHRIEVYNMDGEDLLRRLKTSHRKRNLLVYLDPPYYQKGPALYLNHFDFKKHKTLSREVHKCKFPWVLSYDNHQDILGLYKKRDCRVYLKSIRHTIAGNSVEKELVISKLILPGSLEPLY